MIVVDTNVWSEPLRPTPDPGVIAWIQQHATDLVMPALVAHELQFGAALLAAGRRQERLIAQVDAIISGLGDRLLSYDGAVAAAHARLRAAARHAGHEPSAQDGQIAAHAAQLGAPLATRNTRDFAGLGVTLIDPWSVGD
ncbi:PIN domain-containing protein [Cellulomonas sp. NPDC089187]|uniref:PIN domain-containing protein n=1 Tax=Cellulomonas sp. NPDC089187 TaxID=3154970 RepID=UPI003418A71C